MVLDRQVTPPPGIEVEMHRRGSDVREQPRTTVWLVGAYAPGRGPVDSSPAIVVRKSCGLRGGWCQPIPRGR